MAYLTQTATIGLAALIPALRVQSNYVVTNITTEFDSSKSQCGECINSVCGHPDLECRVCQSCTKAFYRKKTEKKYINEKHTYGSRKPLRKNALLLMLYVHFLNPDKHGFVRLDVEDAASYLKVNEKTIINNLHLLAIRGYIAYGKGPYPYSYQIFISGYSSYFKPANEGGRGYLLFSSDLFATLIQLKQINDLRLALRAFINTALGYKKGQTTIEQSYHELCHPLSYATKASVKRTVSSNPFSRIFSACTKKYTVTITLKNEFIPSMIREQYIRDCEKAVSDLLDQINDHADKNKGWHFVLDQKDLSDISFIALKYPIREIVTAVQQFYTQYICHHLSYRSVGALVRTMVEDNAHLAIA